MAASICDRRRRARPPFWWVIRGPLRVFAKWGAPTKPQPSLQGECTRWWPTQAEGGAGYPTPTPSMPPPPSKNNTCTVDKTRVAGVWQELGPRQRIVDHAALRDETAAPLGAYPRGLDWQVT